MTAPPKRHWFRFTLRTMFVLVTAIAVWLGWNVHIVQERKAVKAMVLSRGGDMDNLRLPNIPDNDPVIHEAPPPSIPWIRRAMGDESYWNINYKGLSDDERRRMIRAFPETEIVQEQIGDLFDDSPEPENAKEGSDPFSDN